MQKIMKRIFKDWIPPALFRLVLMKKGIRWYGDFSSWEEALRLSDGYDYDLILDKVKNAALKVKSGEAVFERDSVIFNEIQYSWPLLAALMWISAQNKGNLNVIDFGGALGSTYFQNRKFLHSLSQVRWNIVEQKHFVDVGKKFFEEDELKFFYDIETCLKKHSPDTIIFSSVIQYLENPYGFLENIKSIGFDFILFDRTTFITNNKDRLTIQLVPSEIYRASYPCWFFNKEKFYYFFNDDYEVIADFDALAGKVKIDQRQSAVDKGIIFRKRQRSNPLAQTKIRSI